MTGRQTQIGKRVWTWAAILTVIVFIYPIENRITRIAEIAGIIIVLVGTLVFWWNKKLLRWTLILITAVLLAAVCLPGRQPQPESLAADYLNALNRFNGTRYIWGGESCLGIDCSGLVRKGFFWGEIINGLKTLNGSLVRDAINVWWHDCSAKDLGNGYDGRTIRLFEATSILDAEYSNLQPGDLAVVDNGIHVMAYLGNRTWIEADPNLHQVVKLTLPADNPWVKTKAVFVRWNQLMK